MWRITIIANALMMGLFWLASLLSVSITLQQICAISCKWSATGTPIAYRISFVYPVMDRNAPFQLDYSILCDLAKD